MSSQPIDYAPRTPPPPTAGRALRWVPYAVFAVCAGISAWFAQPALHYNGREEWFIFVFFGLGALALPSLASRTIAGQRRASPSPPVGPDDV